MIALGAKVRDKITGFEGTATRRTESVGGSTTYLVEGHDNGFRRDEWIEGGRLIETEPMRVIEGGPVAIGIRKPPG